jgi:hypothetical protein
MSVQHALQFIARVREDAQLKEEIRQLGIDPELSAIVAIGARIGMRFTVEELRKAYGYEWNMRGIYHGLQKKPEQ